MKLYLYIDDDCDHGGQWGSTLVSSSYIELNLPVQLWIQGLTINFTSVSQHTGIWINGEVVTVHAWFNSIHYLAVYRIQHICISSLSKRETLEQMVKGVNFLLNIASTLQCHKRHDITNYGHNSFHPSRKEFCKSLKPGCRVDPLT